MRFETIAIREGQEPDSATGAVIMPIYATATFRIEGLDHKGKYEYSRVANPTRAAAEQCLAVLEGAKYGFLFASGMAAENAVIGLLKPGDHVVCIRDVYGGTMGMMNKIAKPRQITCTYVDCNNLEAVEAAFQPNTRILWLESPSNPLTYLVDLKALSALAKSKGAMIIVDNTFATPYFQNPLAMGADIVVHSATKYLGGHSDITAGALLLNNEDLMDPIWDQQAVGGGILSPFESWLLLRGLKTLALRMKAHQENAMAVARFLSEHPKVERVLYPGLPNHPHHELAKKQMSGFSGMACMFVRGGREGAKRFCESTKVFMLANSLGGVESLIGYPPTMSHSAMSPAEQIACGVVDSIIRLSIGIEHPDDLIEDLDQALSKV
jgi:cystathionine beta-lyase/cystathionine gamma-synthase